MEDWMFFYWRIVEELKELNEIVIFRDPGLKRMFKQWVSRHYEAISDERQQASIRVSESYPVWPVISSN
jgi:hypothetical protein